MLQQEQKKKVAIETWGCQMNVADSERMLLLLKQKNYELTEKAEDADLVLLNTCHIREKARHKVVSRLGVLDQLKKKKSGLTIAVAGCVAQAEGKRLLQEAPQIDVLLGPGKISELPGLLDGFQKDRNRQVSLGFAGDDKQSPQILDDDLPSVSGKNEVSRYVNIISGCDNFCTFCVVPFTRGREISRTPEAILHECRKLVNQGAKEVMLLGQNVNSYGLDLAKVDVLRPSANGPFVDLLKLVADIDGLQRLRFTTSNPHDFTKPLAELFRDQPKLGRYIHLPVQSGSDRILASMKRKVTANEYLEKIAWLKEMIPDMAISTDLIVGFPGETDEDFTATVALVEKVKFSFIFSFNYSPRKNTAAARFKTQVPEKVKEARLQELNRIQDRITLQQVEAEIGQKRDVLFLYESKKNPQHYYGRTEHFRLVRVQSSENIVGKTLPVYIESGNKVALCGRV